MTIKAIETRYAGCHFRSRLEARWAVFFDHLGISWEYEPQGFEVTWRLSLDEGTFPYLPDFWLPDQGVWVEVKGALNEDEAERLLNAAASLSSNDGGGCGYDNNGHDLIILGPIPTTRGDLTAWSPVRLHMHKGSLIASAWFDGSPYSGDMIAGDYGGPLRETAARSARFEHGQAGA